MDIQNLFTLLQQSKLVTPSKKESVLRAIAFYNPHQLEDLARILLLEKTKSEKIEKDYHQSVEMLKQEFQYIVEDFENHQLLDALRHVESTDQKKDQMQAEALLEQSNLPYL